MKTDTRQSFSAKVKAELIRLPLGKACCMLSEISALTMTSGHLAFRGGGWISISYRLDDAGTARRLLMLLKKRLNVNPTLHFTQTARMGGRKTCVLSLTGEDANTLLNALHMAETDEDGQMHLKRMAPRHPMTRQCCRRAFLRGAYLGAGTMTNPEKGYHFEWKAEDEQLPRTLEKLLEKCELPYRDYERKGTQVIYLKGAQHIADMLALMGAGQSVLAMEGIRVGKQVKAAATRAANCDVHNGDKMLAEAGAVYPAAGAAGDCPAAAGQSRDEPEGTGGDDGSPGGQERREPPDAAADGNPGRGGPRKLILLESRRRTG